MAEIVAAASRGGTRMTLFGVATMVLGLLVMSASLLTGVSIAILIGVVVLAAGIARMTWALKAGTLGAGVLVFVIGILTALCGVLMVASPLVAAGVLTTLLAVYFVADGVSEIVAAFRVRPASGFMMLTLGSAVRSAAREIQE